MPLSDFLIKRASLSSIFPSVAGPALGGYLGHAIGEAYGKGPIGSLIGGIAGGTLGKYMGERISDQEAEEKENEKLFRSQIPMGAPYDIDPSAADIPAWAVTGAPVVNNVYTYTNPQMGKFGAHEEGVFDVVKSEVPGLPVLEAGLRHGPTSALKTFLAMGGGGGGGALLGLLAGMGANKLFNRGRSINVPLINMPLTDLTAGFGGVIGATKALRAVNA